MTFARSFLGKSLWGCQIHISFKQVSVHPHNFAFPCFSWCICVPGCPTLNFWTQAPSSASSQCVVATGLLGALEACIPTSSQRTRQRMSTFGLGIAVRGTHMIWAALATGVRSSARVWLHATPSTASHSWCVPLSALACLQQVPGQRGSQNAHPCQALPSSRAVFQQLDLARPALLQARLQTGQSGMYCALV